MKVANFKLKPSVCELLYERRRPMWRAGRTRDLWPWRSPLTIYIYWIMDRVSPGRLFRVGTRSIASLYTHAECLTFYAAGLASLNVGRLSSPSSSSVINCCCCTDRPPPLFFFCVVVNSLNFSRHRDKTREKTVQSMNPALLLSV